MAVLNKSIGEPGEEAVVKESIGEPVDVIFELFPFVFHHLQVSNRLKQTFRFKQFYILDIIYKI